MPLVLKHFSVSGHPYFLTHDFDTDGRELQDVRERVVLTIDSNVRMRDNYAEVGHFCLESICGKDSWVFHDALLNTRISCSADLLEAEVAMCQRYIERQMR